MATGKVNVRSGGAWKAGATVKEFVRSGGAWVPVGAAGAGLVLHTLTVGFTGAVYDFVPPAGSAGAVILDLYGAPGRGPMTMAGSGARVRATLAAVAALRVRVGGSSGYNGSGSSPNAGGGGTDVRFPADDTLAGRFLVAAGGGAGYTWSGSYWLGGNGGYPNGTDGVDASGGSQYQGHGGTQTGGGAPGNGGGGAGTLGQGGTPQPGGYGGWGGGGYYGGGGGGTGGGGSSWHDPAKVTAVTHVSAQRAPTVNERNGLAVLSFSAPEGAWLDADGLPEFSRTVGSAQLLTPDEMLVAAARLQDAAALELEASS